MSKRKSELCCPAGALPYHMGNAGDLLKHGALAEFVRLRCEALGANGRFCFLDPFGGVPWNQCKKKIVTRVQALGECALSSAQSKIAFGRYYGSGHLACRAARVAGKKITVHASDGDPMLRKRLVRSGLLPLDFPGFKPECAYSVLESKLPVDGEILLHLDPFGDFVEDGIYRRVIPMIKDLPPHAATMLFVLKQDERMDEYEELRNKHLDGAWMMRCPPLISKRKGGDIRTVRGEGSRYVEVLLFAPRLLSSDDADKLQERLNCFARKLAGVLRLRDKKAEMLNPKVVGEN